MRREELVLAAIATVSLTAITSMWICTSNKRERKEIERDRECLKKKLDELNKEKKLLDEATKRNDESKIALKKLIDGLENDDNSVMLKAFVDINNDMKEMKSMLEKSVDNYNNLNNIVKKTNSAVERVNTRVDVARRENLYINSNNNLKNRAGYVYPFMI